MLPVLKSDHWVRNNGSSPTKNAPPVMYAPLQQHGTPLMYSTAPVTIHHAPHSTYNNNPGPDTYLPFLDRPPPTYSSSLDDSTMMTAYNNTEKPAKLQTQHVSSGSSSWFGKKNKSIVKSSVSSDNVRTLNADAPEKRTLLGKTIAKRDTSKSETSMLELNPILDTIDNIEDGLTDSLKQEKDHSSPSYNLLKCCRVSVRMVKRVVIALIAISAVYTAGMQVYEHVPVGEIFSNIFSLVRSVGDRTNDSFNLTETTNRSPELTVLNHTMNLLPENSESDERENSRYNGTAVVSSTTTTTALPRDIETDAESVTRDIANNNPADKTTAGVETVSASGPTTSAGNNLWSHSTIGSYPGDKTTARPIAGVDTDPVSDPTTTTGNLRSHSTAAATTTIAVVTSDSVNISSDKTPSSPTFNTVTTSVPTTHNSAASTLDDTVTSSVSAVVNSDNTSVADTVVVPATIDFNMTTISTPVSAPSTTASDATDSSIIPVRAETLVNDSDDTTGTDYGTPSTESDTHIEMSPSVVENESTEDTSETTTDAETERSSVEPLHEASVESNDKDVTKNA